MEKKLQISLNEIKKQSHQIFDPVKYGESGIGLCYPGCYIYYNLSYFLENKKILKNVLGNLYKRFFFIPIHLEKNDDDVSFNEKIINYLKSQKIKVRGKLTFSEICQLILNKGKEPYIFLINTHLLSLENLSKILSLIQNQIIEINRLGALAFFESNIYKREISSIFQENNKFLQNIITFPSYSSLESTRFIINLTSEWKIKVSQNEIKMIGEKFGGYLWLLREVLRQKRKYPDRTIEEIINSQGINYRLNIIYNLLTTDEKDALIELCFGNQKKVNVLYTNYFLSTQFIKRDGNRFKLTLPIIEPLLKKGYFINELSLKESNKLLFQKKDISSTFTRQEKKILSLFVENKGQIVSREEIAQIIWGQNWDDHYSDWAIDKLVSRIRNKLVKLRIPKDIIKTKKGLGFLIN